MNYFRCLNLPKQSFFLFGPRGVGKSTWLKAHFANTPLFNLLQSETYLSLSANPGHFTSQIQHLPPETWICLDEIQKLPKLLDEVHHLMEDKGYRFALSGSSARKLKRDGANLLAGRAVLCRMEGLAFQELGPDFDLESVLHWGTLPLAHNKPEARAEILRAYVHTYLREEIKEEGLVRRVEPFVRFLEVAAILNAQQLNVENIARDAKVPRATVDTYLSILEDTLITHKLPAYLPQAKVREQSSPKLYWFDQGVARAAAGLLDDPVDKTWLGTALETFLYHELRVYNHVRAKNRGISYYKTASGSEIDFIIETRKRTPNTRAHIVGIEVKMSAKWDRQNEAPLRSLNQTGKLVIDRMIGVYGGKQRLTFDDFEVLPISDFLRKLWQGEVF